MTLATLRASVLARIGAPTGDSFHTTARLNEQINSALQYVSSLGDWEWLEASETLTTASGTDTYTVSANALRTIDIVDPTGNPLVRKPIDELEYMPGGAAQSATVRFFANYKNTVILRPVPSAIIALKHRYVTVEPVLSGDSDTPLMPAAWQNSIIDRAVYLSEFAAGNVAMAQAADKSFTDWIASMTARADRRAVTRGGGQGAPAAADSQGG